MNFGPKYKLCRRLGPDVFEKCMTQKFTIKTAREKPKRGPASSDYGKQLIEKQKVRIRYGLREKQFANYVKQAIEKRRRSSAVEILFNALESRLDSIIYRLGIASTQAMARQAVNHGHIMVNGLKVTIPSYQAKVGDKMSIRPGSAGKGVFLDLETKLKDRELPPWLSLDPKIAQGTIVSRPSITGLQTAFDFAGIIEFYKR